MKLYDTRSGKKKAFKPLQAKRVDLFVCGPTVYDYSHIGHGRTYVAFDAFVKFLRSEGYTVLYIQNITDIDDKIIARAKERNEAPAGLARNFEAEYLNDMAQLGIDSVNLYARATDYIPQIISQVERLMQKGYAYEIKGDGIYYDISKFQRYGRLSGRTVAQAEDSVSRIDESVSKRNRGDFALWKFSKPDEPKWPSPWGQGRPGWHIEDTAITERELQAQYDIHGGARDLVFPHHEAEIAQMEALSGKTPLANYWMHTGFLTVGGEKMSKSLGNFITIREFLKKHSGEVLRLFVLSSHYRSPVDYNEDAVAQAEANVRRLHEFYEKIVNLTGSDPVKLRGQTPPRACKNFFDQLGDDFNTPKAIAVLFELVRETNTRISKNKLGAKEAGRILNFLDDVNKIFGIIPGEKAETIPLEIVQLVNQREQLRKARKWTEADKVRSQIAQKGYMIKDTLEGPKVKKTA